jgi:hypothetical protein
MNMLMFATLTKARVSIKSTKVLNLVAVRHTTDNCQESSCILGQYLSNKHNVLYRLWTGRPKKVNRKKKKKIKYIFKKSKCTYVCVCIASTY